MSSSIRRVKRFKSPLKVGLTVECCDGQLLLVLKNPEWTGKEYVVQVRILNGHPEGELAHFRHQAPNRFVTSTIRTTYKNHTPVTLEGEFFARQA